MGKFEKRKHTAKILKLWAKKYGNNYNYQLSCCITNPFLKKEQLEGMITQALEGKSYGNINFIPFLPQNAQVNDYLNSIDIDIGGVSGAEGWNLPSFNATCLGKWSIVLNETSHKDWANKDNCILVNSLGKEPCYDGKFFVQGGEFNQGNIYLSAYGHVYLFLLPTSLPIFIYVYIHAHGKIYCSVTKVLCERTESGEKIAR